MGKIIAKLSPGRSAGHDPWAWGSKCGPHGAGITGREGPWEPKNGRETRGNICLEIGKKMPEKWKHFVWALETVVMCLVGVGKCMGVEFGKIGSAPRVLGPSGTPKKARFWSSSNGENYRQIVARAVGWSWSLGLGK